MDTQNTLFELRKRSGLSQQELADKVHVTRQAVSRWETGETQPNTESLQLLSRLPWLVPTAPLTRFAPTSSSFSPR